MKKIFNNNEFTLTTKKDGDNILFNVRDVAIALAIVKVDRKNGKEYLRANMFQVRKALNVFGQVGAEIKSSSYINEAMLYALIFSSKKEEAQKFQLWVLEEVLPCIRNNGGYIEENISSEKERRLMKYSTALQRRKLMLETPIELLEEEVKACLKFHSRKSFQDKKRIQRHMIKVIEERKEAAINDSKTAVALLLSEAINGARKLLTASSSRSYGYRLAKSQRTVQELTEQINYLEPLVDEYIYIPCHGFTINLATDEAYCTKNMTAYNTWKQNFPIEYFPAEANVDFTKPIKIWLYFDHLEKFDVQNFSKTFIDKLAAHYNFDDRLAEIRKCATNNYVDSYKDGAIYYVIKN